MDFVARLLGPADGAMLLFQLRRVGASAEVEAPAKGGSDVQLRGTVPDDKVDALVEALNNLQGALHVGDRHWRLGSGAAPSLEAAEEGLPGPFTVPGTTRSTWSFGGDELDRVAQRLYLDGKQDVKTLHEATGLRVEEVMRALQSLTADQSVRKYRVDGPEQYDLANAVRARIDASHR
ncbi:MAG: hypothetical protein ACPHID_05155 [Thermoplasmatota archaeon]